MHSTESSRSFFGLDTVELHVPIKTENTGFSLMFMLPFSILPFMHFLGLNMGVLRPLSLTPNNSVWKRGVSVLCKLYIYSLLLCSIFKLFASHF